MTAALSESLPYGVRDLKITIYTDASGRTLSATSLDLPNMQTLSFSETEEFQELRGDDRVVTTRGRGAQVEWSLEAGGISLPAWAAMGGGVIIEEGLTPNRRRIMRKYASGVRPFFRIQGRIISDSGGDLHVFIYRCRTTETLEGEFSDGEFFVTSAGGVGLPLLTESHDLLYDMVQNETPLEITTTPAPNPLGPATNVTNGTLAATTATINWTKADGATSYQVQTKTGVGSWTNATGGNVGDVATANITGLTASTTYQVKVLAKRGTETAADSNIHTFTTPA